MTKSDAPPKACCLVSELLDEAGIDRESIRQAKRQVLEGLVLLCQWQQRDGHPPNIDSHAGCPVPGLLNVSGTPKKPGQEPRIHPFLIGPDQVKAATENPAVILVWHYLHGHRP